MNKFFSQILAKSPKFHDILVNDPNHSNIEIADYDFGSVKKLIQFIYKNEVDNLDECHEKLSKIAEEVS